MTGNLAHGGRGFYVRALKGDAMVLKVDRWLDQVAQGVQEVEVAAGIGLQHVLECFVAEFPDGAEKLEVGDDQAGLVDHTGIDLPELAEQIGGDQCPSTTIGGEN